MTMYVVSVCLRQSSSCGGADVLQLGTYLLPAKGVRAAEEKIWKDFQAVILNLQPKSVLDEAVKAYGPDVREKFCVCAKTQERFLREIGNKYAEVLEMANKINPYSLATRRHWPLETQTATPESPKEALGPVTEPSTEEKTIQATEPGKETV